jgi:hypothetical protein
MRAARAAALVVALIAAAGLLLQIWITTDKDGSLPAALANVSQYFTILTNVLVAATMAAVAAGRAPMARWIGGVLLAILVVGAVYHALLARLWAPQGLALVADQLLHTLSPLAVLGWWLAFGKKASLRWSDALVWLVWPFGYCIYALVRARFSGSYPYPFIDLPKLGWLGLAKSTASLAAAFYALGLVLVLLAKMLPDRSVKTPPPRPSAR